MQSLTYQTRRGELETYFDRTAADAWEKLTSDAPVGKIRATVRAGRDEMRATLLSWLPDDLRGARLLDAGCGTGALAIEVAKRGAEVLAIDLSPTMVNLARQRTPDNLGEGWVDFRTGDMLDPGLGAFDYVVSMDSLIHYEADDIVDVLSGFAARTGSGVLFTFAPKTPALALMHTVGRMFPKGDRAPSIEPVAADSLQDAITDEPSLASWRTGRTHRVSSGFYTSQALELIPA
ncbi:MAG: magnesium protoporphyrin IX methyltransferase [Pseudomonadota bacterium]